MNKIVPKILNGNLNLILSETFCLMPERGVRIIVPTSNQEQKSSKDLVINFRFNENTDAGIGVKTDIIDAEITLTLTNFHNSLPMGLTKPIGFTVGSTTISILFVGTALTNIQNPGQPQRTVLFTVTIYEGKTE